MISPEEGSLLEASAYFHPIASSHWNDLRRKIVAVAVQMGYDYDSLAEIPVDWSTDQDANNHVSNPVYGRYCSNVNVRFCESHAKTIGLEQASQLIRGKGRIGPVVKSDDLTFKRSTSYPDSILAGIRLIDVKLDRYLMNTTLWSISKQKIVAEMKGHVVFLDFKTGKPADLTKAGEPYISLHKSLVRQAKAWNDQYAEWVEISKAKASKL